MNPNNEAIAIGGFDFQHRPFVVLSTEWIQGLTDQTISGWQTLM